MFKFNDVLCKLGFNPDKVRLLRHHPPATAAWNRGGRTALGCYASFQTPGSNSPYNDSDIACHFLSQPSLADGTQNALFVGITRIRDRWPWDPNGDRQPVIDDAQIVAEMRDCTDAQEAYDLEWLPIGQDYVERLLIGWGDGTLQWSQWAGTNPKDILELRLEPREEKFPGYSKFMKRISDIPKFPQSWCDMLQAVGGIYLLVADDDNGDQYVGSATGSDGFIGRWKNYHVDGHGGNTLLKDRGHRDYTVSILEIASPNMTKGEIIERENAWKEKLGTRAHGLNAN